MISYEKQGMKRIIQTMAKKGMNVKDIADVTDLSEEEVKQFVEKE